MLDARLFMNLKDIFDASNAPSGISVLLTDNNLIYNLLLKWCVKRDVITQITYRFLTYPTKKIFYFRGAFLILFLYRIFYYNGNISLLKKITVSPL